MNDGATIITIENRDITIRLELAQNASERACDQFHSAVSTLVGEICSERAVAAMLTKD